MINENKYRKGSSLLVAILIMGVLTVMILGLSNLVIREIRQTSDIVSSGQAYYAAESGVENALLDLNNSLPGYETGKANGKYSVWQYGVFGNKNNSNTSSIDGNNANFRYQIRNQGDSYPYFDDDKPIFLNSGVAVTKSTLYDVNGETSNLEKTYNVLPLNQTATIPLFSDCGDGKINNVDDFLLEYYVDFKLPSTVRGSLQDFDILRWKVFGQSNDKNGNTTEAISDFYPAHDSSKASNPVCIGTNQSIAGNVQCILPVNNNQNEVAQGWSYARECYATDAGFAVAGGGLSGIANKCNIQTFIKNHKKNYLTITNFVNPDIIDLSNPTLKSNAANIYYRVVAKGNNCSNNDNSPLPREYAFISADGYAANSTVKQSLEVKLKLNSFLPVFDFSIYRTDTSDTKDSPSGESALKSEQIFKREPTLSNKLGKMTGL